MAFHPPLRLLTTLSLAFGILGAASISHAADITVSAAASLRNAFEELGKDFEAANPGDKLLFNFGASGSLLQQIDKGAPVDVFASADQNNMNSAAEKGLLLPDTRHNFATNTLVLVVPADSKHSINALTDLNQSAIGPIAVGSPASVPAGRYTQTALESASLWEPLQSRFVYTQNVRQALEYVSSGNVGAGFVYGTDAAITPEKVRVALTVPLDEPISYPIAVIKGSAHPAQAKAFVDHVLSDAGQAVLRKYGFSAP